MGEAALLQSVVAACALTGSPLVANETGRFSLGDLVRLDCIDEAHRAQVGHRTVAALPRGRSRRTLRAGDLAMLVERRFPAIAPLETGDPDRRIALLRDNEIVPARRCLRAARSLDEGDVVHARDVEPASCSGVSSPPLLRADRAVHAIRATRGIDAGEPLGSLPSTWLTDIGPGDAAIMISRAGAVEVARDVAVVRTMPNGRLVVRTDDGGLVVTPKTRAAW